MKKISGGVLFVVLITGLLNAGCAKDDDTNLMRGRVICRGGCFNNAYYVDIAPAHRIGKKQTVTDADGNDRGMYENIVNITNLKATDQREGAEVLFRKFDDIEFSCQSSYPRLVREIEINY